MARKGLCLALINNQSPRVAGADSYSHSTPRRSSVPRRGGRRAGSLVGEAGGVSAGDENAFWGLN